MLSQLTAPSTELLLAQIERSLLAHHVRAVGILATDVRDELFLADEIRRRLPDVQLFFYGSNVLRLRPPVLVSVLVVAGTATGAVLATAGGKPAAAARPPPRIPRTSPAPSKIIGPVVPMLGGSADGSGTPIPVPVAHASARRAPPPGWPKRPRSPRCAA